MSQASTAKTPNDTRQQTRAQVLRRLGDALVDGLADGHSVSSMTVERLAKYAGMSRSTFYVYFADKGELVVALADAFEAELSRAARAWWDTRPAVSLAKVAHAVEGLVEAYRTHQVVLVAQAEVGAYDPQVRERERQIQQLLIEGTTAHVRVGQAEGFIDPALDPDTTGLWIAQLLNRGIAMHVVPADVDETEVRVRELSILLWNALYAPVRSAP